MILGKSFKFPGPQFLHLVDGNSSINFWRLLRRLDACKVHRKSRSFEAIIITLHEQHMSECVSVWSLSVCVREREWILCYIQSQIFSVFWLYVLPDLISPNRNWTRATAVKTLSLNHWTTKEFPRIIASSQSLPDDGSSAPLSWGPCPTVILPSTLNSGSTAYAFPTPSTSLGTWHSLTNLK